MSTSLGRLTLELEADAAQLKRDLDSAKSYAEQVAKDIEDALKKAFATAGQGIPAAASGGGAGGSSTAGGKGFFSGILQSSKQFVADIKQRFASLQQISFGKTFSGLKQSFQQALQGLNPDKMIAGLKQQMKALPSVIAAGAKGIPAALGAVGIEAGKRLGGAVLNAAKSGFAGLGGLAAKAGGAVKGGLGSALGAVGFGAFAAAGMGAFNTVTGAVSGAIAKVQEFGTGLFDTLKEVQGFEARLKTFVADNDKRAQLMQKINEFSATTPFELKDIRESVVGVISTMEDPSKLNIDRLMTDMKALGDIAAGAQQPVAELAEKFSKARSEGVANNEDLQEWAGRGIPIYQELGKIVGGTASEVRKMASEGKINFDLLSQAVRNMGAEGGTFYKSMENQSQTLAGKLSNISDTFYQFKEKLAKAFEPLANLGVDLFAGVISGLSEAESLFGDITKETKKLAEFFKKNDQITKAINKSLQDIVKGALKGMIEGVKAVSKFLAQNPNIIKKIATAIASVTKGFFQVVAFAVDLAKVTGGAIWKALNKNNAAINVTNSFVQSLLGLWEENKGVIAGVGEAIGSFLGTALTIVMNLVVGILNYLKEHPAILEVIGKGIQAIAKVFEVIVQAIGQILEGLGWAIAKVGEWAVSTKPVQDFFQWVDSWFGTAMTAMDGIIQKTFDWLKALEPVQQALNWISGLGSGGSGGAVDASGNPVQAGGGLSIPIPTSGNLRSGAGENVPSWIPKMDWKEHQQSLVNQAIAAGITDPNQIKYLLATAEHETGKGQFMREGGSANYLSYLNNKLGNQGNADAVAYRGAGYSQLTGKDNFVKWSKIVSEHFGQEIDLVKNPDLAAHPDIAAFILAKGMKDGSITGRSIGNYIDTSKGKVDFRNARRTINGISNKQLAQIDQVLAGISLDDVNRMIANARTPAKGAAQASGGGAIATAGGVDNPNGGLRIVDSSGAGELSSFDRMSVHHKNRRNAGRGREGGNRSYASSVVHSGQLEELGKARVTGKTAAQLIARDFVLMDKSGNQNVPSPSPASGIVAGIIPSIGAVEIMNDQGQTIATSMHLKNIKVKKGDRVAYGQIIGTQSGVGGYPVHSHVELPVEQYRRFFNDLKTGKFGSAPQASSSAPRIPQVNESGVGIAAGMSAAVSQTSGSSAFSGSSSSSATSQKTSAPAAKAPVTPNNRDLLAARRKDQEELYSEIKGEVEYAQKQRQTEQKEKREQEDHDRERKRTEDKLKLETQLAGTESPEAKKVIERKLSRFDLEAERDDKLLDLKRQREDLELAKQNKLATISGAKKRREEFIANKRKNGEEPTAIELAKFDVKPSEEDSMDFTKAIAQLDKMIASENEIYQLRLKQAGLADETDDKIQRREEAREREIEQVRRKGQAEIDELKKLASSISDEDIKSQIEDRIGKMEVELDAKINLLPFEHQLEDLEREKEELTKAGLNKDSPELKNTQVRIDEVKKQRDEVARQAGVSNDIAANERQQAEAERKKERESESKELEHRQKLAEIDTKIAGSRSEEEKATLEFEKKRLDLLHEQSQAQAPLLDELEKKKADKLKLEGIPGLTEAVKLLDEEIASVNKQLEVLGIESKINMQALVKESEAAIASAKKADLRNMEEKRSLVSGDALKQSRLDRMQRKGESPYVISTLQKEIALTDEANRHRAAMLDLEEKIAALRGTNAELSADEEAIARRNLETMHELNLEKVSDDARTLGKDLQEIGKGAVKDFFSQLYQGGLSVKSILQGVADSLWQLAMELIQSELFGEDGLLSGLFGGKKKKEDTGVDAIAPNADGKGGNWLDSILGGGNAPQASNGLPGMTGQTPANPSFVNVVNPGGLGGLKLGESTTTTSIFGGEQKGNWLDSILGGNSKSDPLAVDMVSANKTVFDPLTQGFSSIFSGIGGLFGGGGGKGGGGFLNTALGAVGGLLGGGAGGGAGGLLSFIPSLLGGLFSEGGVVGKDVGQDPIGKALRQEAQASGRKPVLAVLHEGELVLNREQQARLGITEVPKFADGGMVGGGVAMGTNNTTINIPMTFNGESNKSPLDVNSLRAVINAEIIRQQSPGGSLGSGSYSRRGR